jgi:glycosyltransferase involved in cell wall biosynthesis
MNKPNVCIIVTCYNKEKTIVNAIKSAANQSYDPKAIIVVDDGSTDKSWQAIKSCFKSKTRYEPEIIVGTGEHNVTLYAIKNKHRCGPGIAKNKAMAMAFNVSDLFLFLEGDDELATLKTQIMVNKFLEDPRAIGLIYSDQMIRNHIEDYEVTGYMPPFNRSLLENVNYVEPNYMVSKKAVFTAGKFDEQIPFPDHDFVLRITEKFVGIHIPEVLSTHNILPDGYTLNYQGDLNKSTEITIKKAIQRVRIAEE